MYARLAPKLHHDIRVMLLDRGGSDHRVLDCLAVLPGHPVFD